MINSISDGSRCDRPTPNKNKPFQLWVLCNVMQMFSKFIKIFFIEFQLIFNSKNGSIKINIYTVLKVRLVDKTSTYMQLLGYVGHLLVVPVSSVNYKTTPIESS